MNRTQLALFITVLCSIQICRAAQPFAAGSYVVLAVSGGSDNFLYEYDISGTKLQEISLPVGLYGNQKYLELDASGSQLIVPSYYNTISSVYTYDKNGANIDQTLVGTGNAKQIRTGLMSGQDVWWANDVAIGYTSRGSTSTTSLVENIVSSFVIGDVQLIGTQLFYADVVDLTLKVMDPIVTSDTGTSRGLISIPMNSVFYFHVHKGLAIYTCVQLVTVTLTKYTLQDGQVTENYSFVTDLAGVQAITVVEVSGVTYVLVLGSLVNSSPTLVRYTDTGSSFGSKLVLPYPSSFGIESIAPSPVPICTDGFKNQDETDVDCGGALCSKCALSKKCTLNADCTSGYCNGDNVCATPACDDGVKNEDETDIDCGGATCKKCDDGKACKVNGDCTSKVCTNSLCAVPACDDTVMNGNETDVDCGGPFCSGCAINKKCVGDNDCASIRCVNNLCAESCQDKIQNQDETDVDCGGSVCSKCAIGSRCKVNSDCQNNFCDGIVCMSPPQAVDTPVSSSPSTTPQTVDTPVSGPQTVDSPISTSPSGSDSPVSSTPIKRKPVSTGAITEVFTLGLLVTAALVM